MSEDLQTAAAPARATPQQAATDASAAKRTRKLKAEPATKSEAVIALLSRTRGATIDEMMKATGWQAHSVRGFLAGTLKKKGRTVSSEKTDKGRVYRIAAEAT